MYTAKDGRNFGNHQVGKRYDERFGEKEPQGDQEQASGKQDVSDQDIDSVVAEHGPAHEVHIKHDHEADTHHVESHHGEVVHHSDHSSGYEAHEHARKAAGLTEDQMEDNEEQVHPGIHKEAAMLPGM